MCFMAFSTVFLLLTTQKTDRPDIRREKSVGRHLLGNRPAPTEKQSNK